MKPYLTPNLSLAFVIEWGVLIISILLVFSPFIYLGIRKWKWYLSVSWKQIIASYFLSFAIYYIWEWVFLDKLDRFIYNNYVNTGWLQDAFYNPSFKMIFIVMVVWPLLIFYSTKLIKEKFTRKNLIMSLITASIFFVLIVLLAVFLAVSRLSIIGNKYF